MTRPNVAEAAIAAFRGPPPKCMTCGHGIGPHESGDCQFMSNGIFGDRCGCRRFSMPPLPTKIDYESRGNQYVSGSKPPKTKRLIDDVAAGIRVLRDRDGVELTEEQVEERARNIVTGLLGNYRIEEV